MKLLAIGDFHGKFPARLTSAIKKEKPDLILSSGDYTGLADWRPLIDKQFREIAKGREFDIREYLGDKKYNKLLKKDYDAGKVVLSKLNKLKIKTFSVFGNGDWYRIFFNDTGRLYENEVRKLRNIKDINRGKSHFKSLKIVGFGGYLDPDAYFTRFGRKIINDDLKGDRRRRARYNREKRAFLKLMGSKPELLLIHYTPYKCLDKMDYKKNVFHGKNMGVSLFNEGIKKYQPVLVVCGHMHENIGICKIGKTTIVNPGPASEGKAAIIEIDDSTKKVKNVRFLR
jgi:Icc-related predicted phosphoesterase